MTINAFHPDYIATHYPNFLKDFRTQEANKKAAATLSRYVTKKRQTKPSHGTLFGISEKVKAVTAPAHLHRPKGQINTKAEQSKSMSEVIKELGDLLNRTEYHTYSRAGTSKRKKIPN